MLNTDATHGVCSACRYEEVCTFDGKPAGVVLQCEQFELAFPAERAPRTPRRPRASTREAADTKKYPGICANCEHRETCTYPKPEGGVWRCEDYA